MTTVIILSATTTYAQDSDTHPCIAYGETAAMVMEARQAGVPIGAIMEIDPSNSLFQAMIRDAYSTPRFSTDDYIQEAIQEFSTASTLFCFEIWEE
jgi:hypothetical protein